MGGKGVSGPNSLKLLPLAQALLLAAIVAVSSAHVWVHAQQASTTSSPPLSTTCQTPSFFSTTTLQCTTCPTNQEPDAKGTGCTCAEGFQKSFNVDGITFSCVACPAGSGSTADRLSCQTCPGTVDASGRCSCPAGQALVERDGAGNLLTTAACVSCPSNRVLLSSDPRTCVPCADPLMTVVGSSCTCSGALSQAGDVCISASSRTTLENRFSAAEYGTVAFSDIGQTVSSELHTSYFLGAASLCTDIRNQTACQILANLCVLQLYGTSTPACTVYQELVQADGVSNQNGYNGWPLNIPWLIYSSTDVGKSLTLATSTSGSNSFLPIYLAAYRLNGEWLGNIRLTNESQSCPTTPEEWAQAVRVGGSFQKSCFLRVQYLVSGLPEPLLYDPYIEQTDGTLYPIPVSINGVSGSYRRFFAYDNASGKSSGSGTPSVVRYVASLSMRFETGSVLPQLVIQYASVSTQGLTALDPRDPNTVTASSSGSNVVSSRSGIEYSSDSSVFNVAGIVFLVIALLFAIIFSVIATFRYSRQRGSTLMDLELLGRFVGSLCKFLGDFLLIGTFAIASFWFLSFKLQSSISTTVPESTASFVALVAVAFVFKFIYMCILLYRQTHVDIFFVDWEKPRMGNDGPHPISVWRRLFVANEWNERSNLRISSLTASLLLTLMALVGFGYLYAAKPEVGSSDLSPGETNSILRFWLVTLCFFLAFLLQVLWKYIFVFRFHSNPVTEFVDLCSVSNISIFVLDGVRHGYYIHGAAVFTHADTNMFQLNEYLTKEAGSNFGTRGLSSQNDLQTFEMFLDVRVREKFNKFLLNPIQKELTSSRVQQYNPDVCQGMCSCCCTSPKVRANPALLGGYQKLSRYLKNVVDKVQTAGNRILHKDYQHDKLNIPPSAEVLKNSTFFYDNSNSFTKVWSRGVEWDWFVFEILTLGLLDMAVGNLPAAAVLAWLFSRFFAAIRRYSGRRDLSEKTLIDDRFLI